MDFTVIETKLQNDKYPVYLGVTLDRTLSFNEHCKKVKGKVASRNNLLGKLANSSWGANPQTLKATAMALCYSTAEYCAPVWANSCHAKKVDPELNYSCRTITGNLRSTLLYTDKRELLHHISAENPRRRHKNTNKRRTLDTLFMVMCSPEKD